MTTMTIASTTSGDPNDGAFTAGQIDAHDEHHNGVPLAVIEARAAWYTDHAPAAYALGYSTGWIELARRSADALAVDTAWAYLERAEVTR